MDDASKLTTQVWCVSMKVCAWPGIVVMEDDTFALLEFRPLIAKVLVAVGREKTEEIKKWH